MNERFENSLQQVEMHIFRWSAIKKTMPFKEVESLTAARLWNNT